MPPNRPVSDPDGARQCGPLLWACLPHAHGVPAELAAWAWLGPRLAVDAAAPTRSVHGRPLLGGPGHRHDASWSHSGDVLLVALGTDVAVGADIERLRPRRRALEVARRFFTADEADWLEARPDTARDLAFTRLWCAKEAVLKAHGRGLAFGLHRLAFAEEGGSLRLVMADPALGDVAQWSLRECAPLAGYRAALAWRGLPRAILDG